MITQYPSDLRKIENLLEKAVSPRKQNRKPSKLGDRTWYAILILLFAAIGALGVFYRPDFSNKNSPVQNNAAVGSVVASTTASIPKVHLSYKGYKLSDFSTTTTYDLIRKVQAEYGLRSLTPLESDVPLKEQSIGTRPMVSASSLDINPPLWSYMDILDARTQKYGSYAYQFEVHKLSNSEINLMGFVSEDSFVELNQSQASTTRVRLFPFPYKEFATNYLVLIPINMIVSSDRRDIPVDGYSWGETATLLLTAQNWKNQ